MPLSEMKKELPLMLVIGIHLCRTRSASLKTKICHRYQSL
uniref:Uncharacterized protein n=1 Tax=Arundo donax TaxID=35708 RepID=A0A0A9FLJ4_ARUDO